MHLEALLPRQDSDCIPCPDHPPPCSCTPDQQCIFINRDCHNACSTFKCIAKSADNSSSTSGGPSKGALAGGIVGALLFFGIAVAAWYWYRRSGRFSGLRRMPVRPEDKPAPAAMVLNRPDPIEKPPTVRSEVGTSSVRVYPTSSSNTTIDLDPESNIASNITSRRISRAPSDPFRDNDSIQTAGTEGTNVIPIALVSPDGRASSIGPSRPARSPELNLNLEHVNVSNDSVRQQQAGYAVSQISSISGISSRNSYMSNASYSSDFLNEAPMIMTATKDTVRQVTRAAKPEFINAPPPSDTLKPPAAYTKRPSVGSPLAGASFGPADVTPPPSDDGHENIDPFNDKHASTMASPSASITTFGQPSTPLPNRESADNQWETPILPYARSEDDHSRPSSLSTQAGTVIEIENARRVNVGLSQLTDDVSPQTANFPRSPYRTTMGKLISPMSGVSEGALEEQQQIALAHAQAQARALDDSRRTSGSSFLSAVSTSTRADSILASFPFVPPSPISNRPMRSPPVSPLAQQSFAQSQQQKQKQSSSPTTPTQATMQFTSQHESHSELAPPDRRILGMSTASQLSTASTGLGSFPFQIDTPQDSPVPTTGRQRASLDTLALTSDLASYPLGFDRESTLPYAKP